MTSKKSVLRTTRWILLSLGLSLGLSAASVQAADHGDAPLISNDQGADIADVYLFLDPNDNSFVVMISTARPFITPGESENLGFFQDKLNWRFAIETTGDANSEYHAEVVFSPRTDPQLPQNARVSLRRGSTPIVQPFSAPTTVSSSTSSVPPQLIVTTDAASGISVFAGMTDDPFFFDVPAELQFRSSLIESDPIPPGGATAPGAKPEVFDRGIDTLAGFNVMSVALRIPLGLLGASGNTALGVSGYTEPTQFTIRSRATIRNVGQFVNVDRMGIPAVNAVLIPYPTKDRYNRGFTSEDAAGLFANDIAASLRDLKTNTDNTATLVDLAVARGDFLRLDTTLSNGGPEGERVPVQASRTGDGSPTT